MSKILNSVGRGGTNIPSDVILVQQLLNKNTIAGAPIPLKVDGKAGAYTVERIELFQKKNLNMIKPDGRVDPGGKTFTKLSQSSVASSATTKSASSLQFSQKGQDLLKSIEQPRLKPYDDQTGKDITAWCAGATIGYGHLIIKTEWDKYKNGISSTDASTLFISDQVPYVNTVRNNVTAKLTQNQFDALVIFVYNIGADAFKTSSVLKLVNNPEAKTSHKDLEAAWKAWNKSQGKINNGLMNRRNSEWNVYSKNVYKGW